MRDAVKKGRNLKYKNRNREKTHCLEGHPFRKKKVKKRICAVCQKKATRKYVANHPERIVAARAKAAALKAARPKITFSWVTG